ncbi:transcription termination factor Rho [Kineococcus rhizosphaerae]|uniref:Transcription termination factor Rho n=1 Tax=Kineococcus rhizosphaerae TaxID=559628 RepID=A0A2T0QZ69_9ACTN|nr:transcription termination factor Rho [Kineococcus rhizosphaerae]PRY11746.1 transcription termination factor Rho [Kineococcus rhizosphaerae]
MTDTTDIAATDAATAEAPARRTGSLSALRLPQLQALATELGISGTGRMRKVDLLAAIREHQSGAPQRSGRPEAGTAAPAAPAQTSAPAQDVQTPAPAQDPAPVRAEAPERAEVSAQAEAPALEGARAPRTRSRRAGAPAGAPPVADAAPADAAPVASQQPAQQRPEPTLDDFTNARTERAERPERAERSEDAPQRLSRRERARRDRVREPDQQVELPVLPRRDRDGAEGEPRGDRAEGRGENRTRPERQDRPERQERQDNRSDERPQAASGGGPGNGPADDFDGEGRRGRRNRYRDRKGRRGGREGGGAPEVDEQINEDDVLLPVAGILDVLDNYAFIRTSGYLAGANDVYVSLGQVKKNNLRPGDAVTGAVRQPREGEQSGQRAKFNALVRVDTVNGAAPEQARHRPEFTKLTPLYPQERLRLETEPNVLTTRIIDLMSPLGKGQRGLIVAPPKAGKTMVMQAIANAITTNNPECHLMVVLVDERPEEVTDMQRTIKGEVIASTFDRPASDHTAVAELAIERAKRLVELGNDVVVLLDSLTRLSRAYNISAPASGRILSGGVDASALYPPKRFFGAARNVENGGSLTILASALVETGSKADEVIFEEFKGTGNMEVRLSRQLADKRIFPAVDVPASGTRREEILMSREELQTVWKLRRVVTALDAQASIELLLDRLKKTRSNLEFLHQVQTSTPLVNKD